MKSRGGGDFKSPGSAGTPDSPGNAKKKRRNSTAGSGQSRSTPPIQNASMNELAPPPPMSGYGDTIIASNPFDDTPPPPRQMMGGPPPPPNMPPHMGNMNMGCPPGGPGGPPPGMMMGMGPGGPGGPPMGPGPGGPGGPPNPSGPGGGPPMMNMNNGMPPMGIPPGQQQQWNGPPKPMPMQSGKIYPHDQPMVFNPQNPNAPPIYPCGICHKEVHDNDQAIPCESGCNFWFHRICTGLTEAAYHFLTQEVYAEWVCEKCLHTKNIPLVKFKP